MIDCRNQLTVLLIIKDRPHYTRRVMRHSNETSFPFKILIADGGQSDHLQNEFSANSNFPNLDYTYYRYPYDKTYKEYYEKVADILEKVKTPFCVLADDDNFFSVEGLKRAVSFLSLHSDYGACQGYTIGFSLEPANAAYYGEGVSFLRPNWRWHRSAEQALSAERLSSYEGRSFCMYNSVMRTENAKKIFHECSRINFHDLRMQELFFDFLTLVQGKVRQERYPYLYRQFDVYNSSAALIAKKASHFDRMLWSTFSDELSMFVSSMSGFVAKIDDCSLESASAIVKNAFWSAAAPTITASVSQKSSRPSITSLVKRSSHATKIYRSLLPLLIPMSMDGKMLFHKEKTNLTKFLTSNV